MGAIYVVRHGQAACRNSPEMPEIAQRSLFLPAHQIDYGWSRGTWKFDWHTLIVNKNKEIARLNLVYEDLLTHAGVQIHKGRATDTFFSFP
jgi:pyruvate/2-oxoglutarate dehydrogenase complex dihydrolipoamide dehydrogenase (E3) component